MAWPVYHWEISFSPDAHTGWVDLTPRLVQCDYKWGRADENAAFGVGTGHFTGRNQDLALDPDYPSGIYFGLLDLGNRMRFWMTWLGVTYFLWDGKIADIDPQRQGMSEAWSTFTVEDALGVMASRMLIPGPPTLTTNLGSNKDITLIGTGVGRGWKYNKYHPNQGPSVASLTYQSNGRVGTGASLPPSLKYDKSANTLTFQQSTNSTNTANTTTAAQLVDIINSHPIVAQGLQASIAAGQNGSGTPADFAGAQLQTGYIPESVYNRVVRVLNTIAWPAANRVLDTGATTLTEGISFTAQDDVKALQHLQDLQKAEYGQIFADGQYRIVLQRRAYRGTLTSQGTFSDQPAGGEFGYTAELDPNPKRKDTYLFNYIAITRNGGVAQVVQDAASITKYEQHDFSDSVAVISDGAALTLAQLLLTKYKTPKVRFDAVLIQPGPDDAVWPQVLGRQVSDRVTIKKHPPHSAGAGYVLTRDCYIEAIEAKFLPNYKVTFTWTLSPV